MKLLQPQEPAALRLGHVPRGKVTSRRGIATPSLASPVVASLPALLTDASIRAFMMTRAESPTMSTAVLWLLASQLFVSTAVGGAAYQTVKAVWEGWFYDLIIRQPGAGEGERLVLYGVDVTKSSFFNSAHPEVLAAVEFAADKHRGQRRATGEPYVSHCIETALIVESLLPAGDSANQRRQRQVIIAALCHDVLEDTPTSLGELREALGDQVARMVEGVSQLSKVNQLVRRKHRTTGGEMSENEAMSLISFSLNVSDDPAVCLIKLADRLHNMRTLYVLKPSRRKSVARETLEVWCAIAERLGIFSIKAELEDLAYAVLAPAAYRSVMSEADSLWRRKEDTGASEAPGPTAPLPDLAKPSSGLFFDPSSAFLSTGLKEYARTAGPEPSATASAFDPLGFTPSSSTGGARPGPPTDSMPLVNGLPATPLLSEEQEDVKALLETVLPFDSVVFRNRAGVSSGLLGDLDRAAEVLYREIGFESLTSGLQVFVSGRLKSTYSTHRKMTRKGVPIEQVYDARALRVVVDDEEGRRVEDALAACYRLLPAVHRLWRPVPGETDDYISNPKKSGYQSLHTAVVGPGGLPLEIQIRTSSIHLYSEYGSAAHWTYKEGATAVPTVPARPSSPELGQAEPHVGGRSSSPSPSPSSFSSPVPEGQPVLKIEEARVRDAVVLSVEGNTMVIAVRAGGRGGDFGGILEYVRGKGWSAAGEGDVSVMLEAYHRSSDGLWHRVDFLGRVEGQTVAVPLQGPLLNMVLTARKADEIRRSDIVASAGVLDPLGLGLSLDVEEEALASLASPAGSRGATLGTEASESAIPASTSVAMQRPQRPSGSESSADRLPGGGISSPSSSGSERHMTYVTGPQRPGSPVESRGGQASSKSTEQRIRALRRLLEQDQALQPVVEGRSLDSLGGDSVRDIPAGPPPPEVYVVLMPSARIISVPRGATAAFLLDEFGTANSEQSGGASPGYLFGTLGALGGDGVSAGFGPKHGNSNGRLASPGTSSEALTRLVNINDRLVPAHQELRDGDLVYTRL